MKNLNDLFEAGLRALPDAVGSVAVAVDPEVGKIIFHRSPGGAALVEVWCRSCGWTCRHQAAGWGDTPWCPCCNDEMDLIHPLEVQG